MLGAVGVAVLSAIVLTVGTAIPRILADDARRQAQADEAHTTAIYERIFSEMRCGPGTEIRRSVMVLIGSDPLLRFVVDPPPFNYPVDNARSLLLERYPALKSVKPVAEGAPQGVPESVNQRLPGLTRELWNAFARANHAHRTYEGLIRRLGMTGFASKAITPADDPSRFWEAFDDRYPDSGGYRSLGGVGFNVGRSQALAHCGHHYGSLGGEGYLVHLRRSGDTWRIVRWGIIWQV